LLLALPPLPPLQPWLLGLLLLALPPLPPLQPVLPGLLLAGPLGLLGLLHPLLPELGLEPGLLLELLLLLPPPLEVAAPPPSLFMSVEAASLLMGEEPLQGRLSPA
jgi:hypothetical protein